MKIKKKVAWLNLALKRLLDSFLILLFNELLEELLEEMIATLITSLIGKVINLLLAITLTQATKIIIKRFVKCFTMKEGNDKVKKLKEALAVIWGKLKDNIVVANKFSISGLISIILLTLEGTDVISIMNALPQVFVFGIDIIPYVYYLVLAVLAALGIGKQGFETLTAYHKRIEEEKEQKKLSEAEAVKNKEIKKLTKEKLKEQKEDLKQKAACAAEAEYKKKLQEEVK